ncbi:TPA: hypothetical protein ACIUJK_003652 [Salmonella enterica subsp. enterica serovar Havana]
MPAKRKSFHTGTDPGWIKSMEASTCRFRDHSSAFAGDSGNKTPMIIAKGKNILLQK